MNLLVVIHSLNSGGAERVTSNLVNYWAGKGWQLSVVTLTSQEGDFYSLHPAVRRIALDLAGDSRNPAAAIVNNLRRVVALRRVLRHIRPDVALGMMSTPSILLVLAALFMQNVATIASERIYPPRLPLGRIWHYLRRWSYGRAKRVSVLTRESLAWLEAEIPNASGRVIPNPIPYPLPGRRPALSPSDYLEPTRKLLLAVGRLDEQKGLDLLLAAFTRLALENEKWDLVILGDGPKRAQLELEVERRGLQGRVLLPGRAGNVSDWYERADIYVMSSHFEGFPNTLGEAMAHGCAAVSFDCDTGPRDIIRDKVDGLLVPKGDVAALATALACLMADPNLRKQLGSRAKEVRERFSIEKTALCWEELFVEVGALTCPR